MDAKAEFAKLVQDWRACRRCELHTLRKKNQVPVFGTGQFPAPFLWIYDAPDEEDMGGNSGLSGEVTRILKQIITYDGIIPAETPWMAVPLVACHPYVVIPATDDQPETVRSRPPVGEEIDACFPRLRELIYLTDPLVIFTAGELSWKTLVRPKDRGGANKYEEALGTIYETSIQGRLQEVRYPVVPIPSPKKILANPSEASHGPIVVALKTMLEMITHSKRLRNTDKDKK